MAYAQYQIAHTRNRCRKNQDSYSIVFGLYYKTIEHVLVRSDAITDLINFPVHTCNTGLSICISINRSDGEYCRLDGGAECTPYTLRTPSKLPRIMLSSPAPKRSSTASASQPKVSPRPHTVDQQSLTLNKDIRPTTITIIYNIIINYIINLL